MADAAVSKTVERKLVWVRLPLLAPPSAKSKDGVFVDQFPMTPTIEPGEGAVVAASAPASWPCTRGRLTRREWLTIGAGALCLGGAFTALLFGIG
jgi:hypothetical protein